MTIGEEAKQRFDQAGEHLGLSLGRCFLFGVVIKRPDFILLAEEVFTDGKAIIGIGPDCTKNCWFVHYVAAPQGQSTPSDFMAEAPYSLPFVAFKRRGKVKIYTWDHIRKEIRYGRSTLSLSTSST